MSAHDEFWTHETYAVVGVHAKGRTLIPMFVNRMRSNGKRVVLVDASARPFGRGGAAQPVHATLTDAGVAVDAALIVTEPERSADAVRACLEAGVRRFWLDTRGDSSEAARLAREAGASCVAEMCPLLTMPNAGFPHTAHRWLAERFGQLRPSRTELRG